MRPASIVESCLISLLDCTCRVIWFGGEHGKVPLQLEGAFLLISVPLNNGDRLRHTEMLAAFDRKHERTHMQYASQEPLREAPLMKAREQS